MRSALATLDGVEEGDCTVDYDKGTVTIKGKDIDGAALVAALETNKKYTGKVQ